MKLSKEKTLLVVAVGIFTIFNFNHSITSKPVSAEMVSVNTLPTEPATHSLSRSEDKNIIEEVNVETSMDSNSEEKDNENSKVDEKEVDAEIEKTKLEIIEAEPEEVVLVSAVANSDQDQSSTSPPETEAISVKQITPTETELSKEENETIPETAQELELKEKINLDLGVINKIEIKDNVETKLQALIETTEEEKIAKTERDLIIKIHNDERKKLDLAPLSWSTELSKSAQDWADTISENDCKITHSTSTYGENIYHAWDSIELVLDPAVVVNKWISEKNFYNYEKNTCASGQQCGHYTQVVWKNTEEIGCGVSTCLTPGKKEQVWVCQYDPPGNQNNEKPY